ncbi:MAG TPA: F0F1 ATP synthase subunit B' [Alphaproteobacteria bacterium]|nr:F0F1 ATP synthase subunit B' [Alphaproteobacteria bacterium]
MPQLDPSSFASQLFWLALTFIPLFFILWKVALPRVAAVIEARNARIAADLDQAAMLRDEAKAVLERYEATLKDAHEKGRASLRKTAEEMAADSAKRHAELARELAERIGEAEARIASARDAALANIRGVAGEAAQAATERLIGVKVEGTALAHTVAEAAGEKR